MRIPQLDNHAFPLSAVSGSAVITFTSLIPIALYDSWKPRMVKDTRPV